MPLCYDDECYVDECYVDGCVLTMCVNYCLVVFVIVFVYEVVGVMKMIGVMEDFKYSLFKLIQTIVVFQRKFYLNLEDFPLKNKPVSLLCFKTSLDFHRRCKMFS